MLYVAVGDTRKELQVADMRDALSEALDRIGPRRRVLAIPPDYTRLHSRAGDLTRMIWDYYGDRLKDVLPALGTHAPMTRAEIAGMFGDMPAGLFRVHDWRRGIVTLGEVPADFVREVSEGAVDYPWPAQLGQLAARGGHDLVVSIGQVVPHEVIGMASYNKNLFIGTGGAEGINKSHFLGAAYGMERIMGRADTPVRRVLNYASEHFARDLPILYVHTVVGRNEAGRLCVRGLFVGDDFECFEQAARLSLKVNFQMLDAPLQKVVVHLDPAEYKSTWLGNKSIYRTRMAIADGGELVVLAPGLRMFGEDAEIDRLIRGIGYIGTPGVMAALASNPALSANLGAAAHLIHGSSEGRFSITYCPGGGMSRAEIESVNFHYADLDAMTRRYNPESMRDGFNDLPDGERVFYISNPALGLWSCRERFAGKG